MVFAKRVVPYDPPKYHIMYGHKSASSWSISEIFDGVYENKWASIALNANDMPYVAWSSDATGVFDIYLAEYEQQWAVYDISNQPLEEQRPNIAIDAQGNVHLVWHGPGHGQGASEIYYSKVSVAVTATVDIDSDTLNLKSEGQWITAYIQLPEEYNPEDIDATTILLNETIQPVLDPKYDFVTNSSEYLVDHNEDGILERMVKFDRAEVMALLSVGDATLTITGEVNGTSFEGSDTIRVIDE